MSQVNYVLGFYLSSDKEWVALIEKLSPKWQKGLLNGVGGKLEVDDWRQAISAGCHGSQVAMAREFEEETGVVTTPLDWEWVAELSGEDWRVFVLRAYGDPHKVRQTEKEVPRAYRLSEPLPPTIPNLKWIIPLILDDEVAAGTIIHYDH